MRIGAYYAVHYGADYLEFSLRSVLPAVDVVGIFYAALPSHGHRDPRLHNPDSREDLQAAVERAGGGQKVRWLDGNWFNEGQHRDHALRVLQAWGCDMILVVDSDEVWDTAALVEGLANVQALPQHLIRLNFIHFWRSFGWVCRDAMMPIRIIKKGFGEVSVHFRKPCYHFGYAQRPEMVRYKAIIHGHRGEWRNGWYEHKFLGWSPYPPNGSRVGDVHPTCGGIWYPERFDPAQLPSLMRQHPYWGQEVIG